jgi:CheY-like chemotaxis protein
MSLSGVGGLSVDGRPCSALVVDDNAINRQILDILLTEAGSMVVQAENGQVACETFARSRFDVVFMDIEMPVVNGYTATRVIRAFEAERGMARTPIIMVSAHVGAKDIDEAMAAGADLHLGKPVNVASLLAATRDALDGWQLRPAGKLAFYYA